jgi:hypothetical protein
MTGPRSNLRLDRESLRHAARHSDKLKRDLQNSAESAKSTAPSRSRLSKRSRLSMSSCFNAGIMSRARKQAVSRHLDKLKHVPHEVFNR